MTAKIIIGASADETRMGLVENGKLMECLVERTAEQHLVGSIFKGRVCNVVRGIQAAFGYRLGAKRFSVFGRDHGCNRGPKRCRANF